MGFTVVVLLGLEVVPIRSPVVLVQVFWTKSFPVIVNPLQSYVVDFPNWSSVDTRILLTTSA